MTFRHEEIIKQSDGSRLKILVTLKDRSHGFCGKTGYHFSALTCKKGKRTWISTTDCDSWDYRAMPMEERRQKEYDDILLHINEIELFSIACKVWDSLHPEKLGVSL